MCVQMGELSFDFAEGLVVGLGIDGKEKRILAAKWQEFTKNAFTFTVRPASILKTLVLGHPASQSITWIRTCARYPIAATHHTLNPASLPLLRALQCCSNLAWQNLDCI